jgi:hypothetical protein
VPAIIYTAPDALPDELDRPSVFLAGSIDQGEAEDWQAQLAGELAGDEIAIFNPRRAEWDPSWDTDSSHAGLREQVGWELDAQGRADLIAFYFAPGSRAPVTLLELGLAAGSGRALVCCPKRYWRSGNVDLVCMRYGIGRVESLCGLGDAIARRLSTPKTI